MTVMKGKFAQSGSARKAQGPPGPQGALTSGVFFLNSRLWSMSFFLDCSLSSCLLASTVAVASSSLCVCGEGQWFHHMLTGIGSYSRSIIQLDNNWGGTGLCPTERQDAQLQLTAVGHTLQTPPHPTETAPAKSTLFLPPNGCVIC